MAVDGVVVPTLAIRSSVGIELWSSKGTFAHQNGLPKEDTKVVRTIIFSPDGKYLAYTNGAVVKIYTTSDWQLKTTLPRPKAFYLKFSPRGNYLVSWELYTITQDRPEGSSNMFVYKSDTGEEVFSTIQKKQTDWEPSWSLDETIFAVMSVGEAYFYELQPGSSEGFKTKAKVLSGGRGSVLSLAPAPSPPYIAFYTPGSTKGAPSMCKIYKYPALGATETIACKSFFQADRVELLWNKRGSGLLILTSTEIDKTGASYYGNQALHFMSTKGESCAITLKKEGPIHQVQWSPKGTEFVIVYGYMPSSATLFNLKCDPIFNFSEGAMNCAYFNDFGNLLLLGGFGNLRGAVSVWDLTKKCKVSNLEAPDSTYLEWSPSGEEFVTATTAPRLRIANGFKIWHYSGALLHETLWPEGQELYGVEWQKFADGVFKENPISRVKVEGIKSSQPSASKQVYRPPNVRMMIQGKPLDSIPQSSIPGLPPGYTSTTAKKSKNAVRKQRSRNNKSKQEASAETVPETTDANPKTISINNNSKNDNNRSNDNKETNAVRQNRVRKPKTNQTENNQQSQQQQPQNQQHPQTEGDNEKQALQQQNNRQHQVRNNDNNREGGVNNGNGTRRRTYSSSDPEKSKKIRTIYKQLSHITVLKARRNAGEPLSTNEISKMASEINLKDELKALKISA